MSFSVALYSAMDLLSKNIGFVFFGGLVAAHLTRKLLLHEISILPCIAFAIYHDEFMSNHLGLVLYYSLGFLLMCHLLVLHRAVAMRPKPSAEGKTLLLARDTDLEYDDEIQVVVSRKGNFRHILRDVIEFYKFRPAYGILTVTGFLFLTSVCAIRLFPLEDENLRKDFRSASLNFILPGIVLISVPWFVATTGIYALDDEKKLYSYRPFQEKIEVPFKVLAGKFVAAVVSFVCSNILYSVLLFGCITFTVCSLLFTYYTTDEDFESLQVKYVMHIVGKRYLLMKMFGLVGAAELIFLGNLFVLSWRRARRCLFGTIEKNWRRNLRAIEYLLPDGEVETLEDLQAALNCKVSQQLTEEEKRAFNYIKWPLWQTKLPFFVLQQRPSSQEEIIEQPQRPENEAEDARNLDEEQSAANEIVCAPPPEFSDDQPSRGLRRSSRLRQATENVTESAVESYSPVNDPEFRTPAPIERKKGAEEDTPLRRSARLRRSSQ